jgi:hypothetical protein
LEGVLILKEDDWRQIEFLNRDLLDAVADELKSIREIYQNERVGTGFRTLHVRNKVPEPLAGRIVSIQDVRNAFGVEHKFNNLAFKSTKAVINGGFAIESTLGIEIWGQNGEDGILTCLCFSPLKKEIDRESFKSVVGAFVKELDLIFVDWVNMLWADSPDFEY